MQYDADMKCDYCDRTIDSPYPGSQYLLLKPLPTPNTLKISLDFMMYPILQDEKKFCGLGCLGKWLEKEKTNNT